MARRMTLEGGHVKAVCEIMEDSGGLTRNIVQCLNDFNIPLKLHHTVVEIHGKERVEGVTIARVDDDLKPIKNTEEYIACDTLMLSVGLIPENELSKKAGIKIDNKTKGPIVDDNRQTTVRGIFACGNVVRVHELVDFVSEEGEIAGKGAAIYAKENRLPENRTKTKNSKQPEQKKGIKNLSKENERTVICTICPMGCKVAVFENKDQEGNISYRTVGNTCKRGEKYAIQEVTAPQRTLTTTMAAQNGVMIPVKTDRPIPYEKMKQCISEINCKTLILPICRGDIIIESVGGTDANVVATRTFAD